MRDKQLWLSFSVSRLNIVEEDNHVVKLELRSVFPVPFIQLNNLELNAGTRVNGKTCLVSTDLGHYIVPGINIII